MTGADCYGPARQRLMVIRIDSILSGYVTVL